MTYKDIIDILLSKEVYNNLKKYEKEVFELIPELKKCKGFNQNNNWHIYDVYEHILHVVSGVDAIIYLRLAALFHDIGKPITYTEDEKGIGHFYDHWKKSYEIFSNYKNNFGLNNEEKDLIANLIFYHDINIKKLTDKEKITMLNIIGIENIDYLFELKKADLLAQSPQYHSLLKHINDEKIKTKKLKI